MELPKHLTQCPFNTQTQFAILLYFTHHFILEGYIKITTKKHTHDGNTP